MSKVSESIEIKDSITIESNSNLPRENYSRLAYVIIKTIESSTGKDLQVLYIFKV